MGTTETGRSHEVTSTTAVIQVDIEDQLSNMEQKLMKSALKSVSPLLNNMTALGLYKLQSQTTRDIRNKRAFSCHKMSKLVESRTNLCYDHVRRDIAKFN